MTDAIRRTLLLAGIGLSFAAPGMAGAIRSTNGGSAPGCGIWGILTYSSVPTSITLVGSAGGAPDATDGQFTVVIRSQADVPLAGASVVIDLSGCEDLTVCSDQLDPAVLATSASKYVRKFTDSEGRATFTLLGSSNGAGNASTLLSGGRIYANGVLLSSPTVAAYDLDGTAGIGSNDLSAWLTDFGSGIPFGRSDYDGSGDVGANDLSFWFSAFGTGQSATSCTSTGR